jgi:hypothetical protein
MVVAGPVRAEALPPYEALVAQFEEVAFWRDGKLRRYKSTISFALQSDTAVQTYFSDAIAAVLKQLAEVASVSFHRAQLADAADMSVVLLPLRDLKQYLNSQGRNGEATLCFAYTPAENGRISGALALIPNDLDSPRVRYCMAQEIMHAMGLHDGKCRYQPSHFCEIAGDVIFPYPPGDLALLKTLYDPRLKPGMTRAEAMPIARVILREIVSRPAS